MLLGLLDDDSSASGTLMFTAVSSVARLKAESRCPHLPCRDDEFTSGGSRRSTRAMPPDTSSMVLRGVTERRAGDFHALAGLDTGHQALDRYLLRRRQRRSAELLPTIWTDDRGPGGQPSLHEVAHPQLLGKFCTKMPHWPAR